MWQVTITHSISHTGQKLVEFACKCCRCVGNAESRLSATLPNVIPMLIIHVPYKNVKSNPVTLSKTLHVYL